MCYSRNGSHTRSNHAGETVMTKHSKHTWVVDVIEEGSASIEVDGRTVTPIPAWLLPEGVREGDVLSVTHDRGEGKSALVIETDPEAKKKALDRSAKQVSRKSKNDPGGNVQL
jgi:predicted transcriptional regulator